MIGTNGLHCQRNFQSLESHLCVANLIFTANVLWTVGWSEQLTCICEVGSVSILDLLFLTSTIDSFAHRICLRADGYLEESHKWQGGCERTLTQVGLIAVERDTSIWRNISSRLILEHANEHGIIYQHNSSFEQFVPAKLKVYQLVCYNRFICPQKLPARWWLFQKAVIGNEWTSDGGGLIPVYRGHHSYA